MRNPFQQQAKRALHSWHESEEIRSMLDVVCLFGQDCIFVVVEPAIEITDVSFWDRWPCSDLRMLDNEFI